MKRLKNHLWIFAAMIAALLFCTSAGRARADETETETETAASSSWMRKIRWQNRSSETE